MNDKDSLQVRPARMDDLGDILKIYAAARRYMAESGNPNQWGSVHPAQAVIEGDIASGHGHVVTTADGRICGAFAFIQGDDPTYAVIEDGQWLNDRPYGTIHRVAGDGSVRGVFTACLKYCRAKCGNIRIDTHNDNATMQHVIEKHGFTRCGTIYVSDGSPRLAYQLSDDQ